jgi:hypothetical protein
MTERRQRIGIFSFLLLKCAPGRAVQALSTIGKGEWRLQEIDGGNRSLRLRHRGPFPEPVRQAYISAMRNHPAPLSPRLAGMLLAFAAFAAMSGLAFAMWMQHGTKIFLTMAESGLSWCF